MTINGVNVGPASITKDEELHIDQVRNVMEDGTVRVRNKGVPYQLVTITIPRMTNDQWTSLKAAMIAVQSTPGSTVSVVDDYSVTHTFYWWDKALKGKRRLGRFWSATIKFRVAS
jgi:hypothetical protein